MKPLPIHLKGAALGLAALITLSSAAALNAAWRHSPQPANPPVTDTDAEVGCEVNPLNLC